MRRSRLNTFWMIFLIGVFLLFACLAHAEAPAITGSQQMQVNASQILTASGGCWGLRLDAGQR